ncbi:acyl-CoA dehydrogenase family protein [soil metagenome]
MDFSWNEEQLSFRASVIAFAERELADDVVARDHAGTFARDHWRKCATLGIQGLPVPAQYGGGDADPLTITLALEALGYACRDNGLLFSLNAHMWSAEVPLVRFGSEAQKERYLPGLCDGSLVGVQAMTEPESGSDAFSLTTTAVESDGGWVLNGNKTFITNAPVADLFVVFATRERGTGWSGVSAFLVERSTQGLTVGAPLVKMGLRTSPMSEVAFSDCNVGVDALLGPRGGGLSVFTTSMDWERSFILATAVGSMQRQLEHCITYAKERRQFGQPISRFQAVSHRIVDMKLRLKGARLSLHHLAWLRTTGQSTTLESAEVKLAISEAYLQSSLDALSIYGAYGYMAEYEVEREVRDAIASRIYSGTSDIQRNLVASKLGL